MRGRSEAGRSAERVSLIIPAHQVRPELIRCLASVGNLDPPPLETLIVVDGPDDASFRKLDTEDVRILCTGRRIGPAVARNLGAAAAHGELLLFIDSDVEVPVDLIQQVQNCFSADPEVDAIIGSYDADPGTEDFLSVYRNLLHHYVHQEASEDASTFWGACGAIRRRVFLRVGGFDERFRRPSIEDIELGYRLKGAGARIRLVKTLQVKHLKRWTPGNLVRTDLLDRAYPWSLLLLQRKQWRNDLNIRMEHRINTVLTGLFLATAAGSPWAPSLLIFSCGTFFLWMGLNRNLYRFFARCRGWRFAVKVVPWQGVYYLCCGIGFAAAWMTWLHDRIKGRMKIERAG